MIHGPVRHALLALALVSLIGTASPQGGASPGGQQPAVPIAMERLPVLQRALDVGPADPAESLGIAVSLHLARPEAMETFLTSVSDPASPDYRRFITPEQVGERFGPTAEEVQRVADYLAQNGFAVTLVAKNRLAVLANATVAQAEAAFHTTLRRYTIVPENEAEPATFIAYARPIQLPPEIAPLIVDVSGLETYTRPRHLVTLLTPTLTRSLYDAASMFGSGIQGQGRTLGMSNWSGFRASNYLLYISHFSLPVPAGGAGSNISVIPCGGGGAGAGPDNAEGNLDIQMELGVAPLATIRVYDGTAAGNLVTVLTLEANDNLCDAISESYGWNLPTSTANAAHNQHLSMSAQGITYMAASGDNGTTLEPFSYPDYEPEVLSIGGTVANVNASTGLRISENGWNGSGGSWSNKAVAFNVRPSWQTGTGVLPLTAASNHRLVPDIAFHASGGQGAYSFYNNGVLTNGFIGTSFSSPVFAGLLALVEQKIISLGGLPPDPQGHRRFGRMQDLIYGQNGMASVWHDITSGNNGTRPDGTSSTCTPGWDSVTGWGPMDCLAFANLLGCGADADGDGTPDCTDGCPNDPGKIAPGSCGCGVPDTDNDLDGTPDCHDGCPNDPNKIAPGACGCGVADTDSDGDGTPNCNDGCPNDPAKLSPGSCGCGVPDTDSDGDGTPNCHDGCPNDPGKVAPGTCGCGVPDTDSDGDGTPNCNDGCPNDPAKLSPGSCGCGVPDTDSDGDGTPNCHDGCPSDPAKVAPGACGCGVADTDSDGDGVPNCNDGCPSDPNKLAPGACGCGAPETDSDGDGAPDCVDGCPNDPGKAAPGACGCGVADSDSDGDGTPDCNDGCANDPNKTAPGVCGCGAPDADGDGDGTLDCLDGCPSDPLKIDPGACGCGVPDTDGDGDGVPDCSGDQCPNDPDKTAPGICGCGTPDTDSDGDGTADCIDLCPSDPAKLDPGACGCGVADADSDGDGTADCIDGCVDDPDKTGRGVCGCGVPDTDTDGDGAPDCIDNCPALANPDQTDCDGDGEGDACALASGHDGDCDADGIPDDCESDCNQNGTPDDCDLASGFSRDLNGDLVPDDCQGSGVEYCFGDGSGASCPCGNVGGYHSGCANSSGNGGRLYNIGGQSFAGDDAAMTVIHLPVNKSGLVFMGHNQISAPFGDGRLCIAGQIKRFPIHNSGASGSFVQGTLVLLSNGAIQPGSTWNFQGWYRDPQGPCAGTYNLTNAVQLTFN